MTPEQFCYWLHGFFEIAEGEAHDDDTMTLALTTRQAEIIRDHLNLVFTKVTPDRGKKQVINEKTDGQKFQEVLKVDPFSRPDVYCVPTGKGRIC